MRKRLLFGSLLAAGALLVVVVDALPWFVPWYPCVLVIFWGASHLVCQELLVLLAPEHRPRPWLCHLGIASLVFAGWLANVPLFQKHDIPPWYWILGTFVGYFLSVFLTEMAFFRQPGGVVLRLALTTWVVGYLGLLPSFLFQMRWLEGRPEHGATALLLTIFVPKCCDIGAYFSGKFLGRNRMTPLLSPKKTWEGAVGGLLLAVVAAVLIDRVGPLLGLAPLLQQRWWIEVGFGLSVGLAGMLGDLAESMIKRDCGYKDAGQAVPGFGGVLDVVDAVIFAAPVSYLWLWGLPKILSGGGN